MWQPYVIANVWRDWGADATTMFGSDPVPLLEKATRLEFAGGLSAKILPGLSLYAQAGVRSERYRRRYARRRQGRPRRALHVVGWRSDVGQERRYEAR